MNTKDISLNFRAKLPPDYPSYYFSSIQNFSSVVGLLQEQGAKNIRRDRYGSYHYDMPPLPEILTALTIPSSVAERIRSTDAYAEQQRELRQTWRDELCGKSGEIPTAHVNCSISTDELYKKLTD